MMGSDRRGQCYCNLWETSPATLMKQGIPRGFCGPPWRPGFLLASAQQPAAPKAGGTASGALMPMNQSGAGRSMRSTYRNSTGPR